jgi:Calcineurin-like phosphoesterase
MRAFPVLLLAGAAAGLLAACGGDSTTAAAGSTGAGSGSGGSGGRAATATASSTAATTGTASSSGTGGASGLGPAGGELDELRFAIVGDTRPASIDDTPAYPKAIIQKIWQDIDALGPRPDFAVTTGDYMFAKSYGAQSGVQLDLYLAARAGFSNIVYPAMGNHECTGATASNCGPMGQNGITVNYSTYMSKMLGPLGLSKPYYTVTIAAKDTSWTAKFVFVAANAWDAAQSAWLGDELAKPTTYTFVVRHEANAADTAPGVTPSKAIVDQHPYTLTIAGHTHTFDYSAGQKQVIVGNGGAPLSGGVNYGYTLAARRADGAIEFKSMDYMSNTAVKTFAVKADGTPTP